MTPKVGDIVAHDNDLISVLDMDALVGPKMSRVFTDVRIGIVINIAMREPRAADDFRHEIRWINLPSRPTVHHGDFLRIYDKAF